MHDSLPEPNEEEEDMLDLALGLTETCAHAFSGKREGWVTPVVLLTPLRGAAGPAWVARSELQSTWPACASAFPPTCTTCSPRHAGEVPPPHAVTVPARVTRRTSPRWSVLYDAACPCCAAVT